MLFYLLSTLGFLILSSTIVVVGSCYYFLIQSMLNKSKGAAGNLIVGILGEIISYDPVEFGINYDADVNAVVIDTCSCNCCRCTWRLVMISLVSRQSVSQSVSLGK